MVADRGAAERLVVETNEANAGFGTMAALSQAVVADEAAPVPSPVITQDPELWQEAAPVELAPAVPATRDQTYLVLGDDRHLVMRTTDQRNQPNSSSVASQQQISSAGPMTPWRAS